MSERFHDIAVTVNGEEVRERVDARKTLVDFLREDVALTGSHVGCEHGVCGACSVRVDGVVVRGCLMLAVQCDGARVDTIEGVADTDEIADLQQAFVARNALQCGYCTPGMLLTAQELLSRGGVPSREQIRTHLSGNYCRCTGYQAIVDAVEAVARARLPTRGARLRAVAAASAGAAAAYLAFAFGAQQGGVGGWLMAGGCLALGALSYFLVARMPTAVLTAMAALLAGVLGAWL